MNVAVIDAGIAIGWTQGRHRSLAKLDRLLRAGRSGRIELVISVVNLAEVLLHTADLARATGVDTVALLTASRVRMHQPDEAIARRVAKLPTSLADGFAAATAQELGARLHTTDAELIRQLRATRLAITRY
ncbi:MAG TPA: PIN domain-containing protein [Candidatus Binatia bacterium]|nr:PIN domain-containing protein [Candidatus Binatia bacterium]